MVDFGCPAMLKARLPPSGFQLASQEARRWSNPTEVPMKIGINQDQITPHLVFHAVVNLDEGMHDLWVCKKGLGARIFFDERVDE